MTSRKKRERENLNQAGHCGRSNAFFLTFPFRHHGPVLLLPFQHPTRILLRQLTDLVQHLEFLGPQGHHVRDHLIGRGVGGYGGLLVEHCLGTRTRASGTQGS